MNKQNKTPSITLGSLFDGIGGFPYAASFFGIKPLWASEIMPQAISVTQRHLPDMEHVGDITTLGGAKLPPVDIITFGSPCQGLSMAGRRLGLADERSGLFSEAIRIIEEMRRATNGKYPRYAVWENVPGALSSNTGLDYKAVIEAFTKAEVPVPRSGKWANAGMVRSDGIDLAWCVYNAQYFGVPQRRRRIFLVCDFGGRSAGEILFIPKSLSGYFAARREAGQDFAANAERGIDGAGVPSCLNPWDTQQSRIFVEEGLSPTLTGADGGGGRNPGGLVFKETDIAADAKTAAFMGDSSASSFGIEYLEETSPTLKPRLSGTPCLCEPLAANIQKCAAFLGGASAKARSIGYSEEVSPTLKGEPCGFSAPCVCEPIRMYKPSIESCAVLNDQGGDSISVEKSELSPTLRSETHGNLPIVAITDTSAVTMYWTLVADDDQYFFALMVTEAYPISMQIATRHNVLGEGTGFGIGNDGDPAYTLQQAHSHAVAVGVHQNQSGDVNTAPTAYSLATNGNATGRNAPLVCENIKAFSLDSDGSNSMKSSNPLSGCRVIETARTLDTTNPCPSKNQGGVAIVDGVSAGDVHPEISGTLAASGAGMNRPGGMASETDLCVAYCLQGNMIGRQDHNGPKGNGINEDLSFTLTATDTPAVASVDCRNYRESEEISGTLQAKTTPGYSLNYQNPVRSGYIVRRLLPVECERLQGYPDGWTAIGHDGKEISDTRRYQMLGNSVAVPCVAYILLGIAEQMRFSQEPSGLCLDVGKEVEVAE